MRVLIGRGAVPRRFAANLLWEPRDIWVGVFWNRAEIKGDRFLYVYISLVPCFPLSLVWRRA